VAGRTSGGDHPVESANGAVGGPQTNIASQSSTVEDDPTVGDRPAADRRRGLAGADQAAANGDQAASDSDQAAADSDQAAADSDQAASDRDLVHGGDRGVHDFTRELRERSARLRQQSAEGRIAAANARDTAAHARDLAARARDEAAALRDRELAARDAARPQNGRASTGAEILLRAAENRSGAAADRAAAVEGRASAAADREQAAHDREQAARDRVQAQIDRDALLAQLAIAETDALTGTRTRAAGLADLDHAIDRARRTTGLLVVAHVGIIGMRALSDARGRDAGDALMQRGVRAIRGHLRSSDLIVRLDGDELLCVMFGATADNVRERFDDVQAELAGDPDSCEIRVGLAALAPHDSATELIERADARLPSSPGC
jgi:diguanylate cyclase (GGDEF)-like protein